MRLTGASLCAIFMAGCSTAGLERQYYPASEYNVSFTGTIIDYHPFKGEIGETKTSRAAIGFLTGGLVGLALSTSNSDDVGKSDAIEYIIRDRNGNKKSFVSIKKVNLLDCVDVYGGSDRVLVSLTVVGKEKCG